MLENMCHEVPKITLKSQNKKIIKDLNCVRNVYSNQSYMFSLEVSRTQRLFIGKKKDSKLI